MAVKSLPKLVKAFMIFFLLDSQPDFCNGINLSESPQSKQKAELLFVQPQGSQNQQSAVPGLLSFPVGIPKRNYSLPSWRREVVK